MVLSKTLILIAITSPISIPALAAPPTPTPILNPYPTATPATSPSTPVTCPSGWTAGPGKCIPPAPSAEYFNDPVSGYPVCGSGRVPAKPGTQGIKTLDLATSNLPRSTATSVTPTYGVIQYATTVGSTPQYMYAGHNRCVCAARNFPYTAPVSAAPSPIGPTVPDSTDKLFISDDYNTVLNTSNNNPAKLPVVPIYSGSDLSASITNPPDARPGVVWKANNGMCGCPNFNEKMVPIVDNSSTPVGAYCYPVAPGLALSQVTAGDIPNNVMHLEQEPTLNGQVARFIKIPDLNGTLHLYERKIWKCADASKMFNRNTGVCETALPFHKAGVDDPSVPPSEVSPRIGGADPVARWNNTINKKMAVCLNGFGLATDINATTPGTPKLDCIDNSMVTYVDFNDLWSSTDVTAEGGLPNAVVLANADGQPISGFYSLEGQRCPNCNEFAGPIQPAMINPKGTLHENDSPVSTGPALLLPGERNGSDSAVYQDMKTKFTGQNKMVPTSTADRRKWPILVRTAAVYRCPDHVGTAGSNIAVSEVKDPVTGKRVSARCTAAADIKIHMRIEQITEIKGLPKMAVQDSVISGSNSSLSIQRVIAEKFGAECPTGMRRNPATGACAFY